MNYEKYENVSGSGDSLEFDFVSEGSNGKFTKSVQFTQTQNPEIFNLGFGDRLDNGEIDDLIRNNNQDRKKILATIAAIVYEFTSVYREKLVFFTGSTPERTRLYRMALSINFDELRNDFKIFGVNFTGNQSTVEPFEIGKQYLGFLIKRKAS